LQDQENRTASENAKLASEYKECCEDWRLRDRYVLDKLSAAGILFALVGVASGTIPEGSHLIRLFLLGIGGLFSLILTISITKDIYYRDGTERLMRRLCVRLGVASALQRLGELPVFDGLDTYINSPQDSQFPRKVGMDRDRSLPELPRPLRNWLLNRHTFRWILAFYLGSFFVFATLFVLVVINWVYGRDLPI